MLGLLLQVATVPATPETAIDFTWLFIKMMASLVIVCIVAFVSLKYVVPRLGLVKKYSDTRFISIIAKYSLSQKRHLYIVRVGEKYSLVGSSEVGISKVMDLDKKDVENSSPL